MANLEQAKQQLRLTVVGKQKERAQKSIMLQGKLIAAEARKIWKETNCCYKL